MLEESREQPHAGRWEEIPIAFDSYFLLAPLGLELWRGECFRLTTTDGLTDDRTGGVMDT